MTGSTHDNSLCIPPLPKETTRTTRLASILPEPRLCPRRRRFECQARVSWNPLTQQNVPGATIRRFCDSTGYALIAPSEPTRFHRNCRNTTINIAICKGMAVSECTSIPELSSDHNPVLFEVSLDNFTSPALSIYSFPNWYKFRKYLLTPFQEIKNFQPQRY
ncbi:hypothetical protein TNCV_2313581 [Trichonephila clavipes]|nr:hypothetical protein TNCV_2313581 [Trichonephila clavipes]